MRQLVAGLLCTLAAPATAEAHVLDQYLQVAQISLTANAAHVELRLAPGVEVADHIFAQMDRDGDGVISAGEEDAYARRVLREVTLEVDGRPTPLALAGTSFPSRGDMSEGVGVIRLDLTADAPLGAAGEHRLSFRNDHLPEVGAYLVNVLVPTTEAITITEQQRDRWQHQLQVRFRVAATAPSPLRWAGRLAFAVFLALTLQQWRKRRLHAASA